MATPSVKRKLRSGKVFALPSTVRKPNSDAARHWLENEDCKHIATSFRDVRHTEAAKSHASQRTNRDRFPDAIVRVLRGDANLCDVAAEAGIKPAALEEVLGRVQADLYSLFGKNAASMPAAVLELLRKDPGQLASIRRLRSAKRKASKQTNPPAGTASQLLREAEETIRERDGELTEALDHIAELSRQIAALKEELAQARRGAAIDDAVSSASVQSNRTAGASLDADEGMDLDDAPGTSNNAVRANDGTTHSILKRIHHELNGSFGEPNKYVYEATFADGTSNAGGLLTRMRPKTEPVVCKRLEIPKTEDELDYMLFEINVMKTHGHHPNIIGCLEVYYSKSFVSAIMPYMDAGTIKDVIDNARLPTGRRLQEDIAASYIKQVLKAVEYLHRHGIVHRDLKPDNVFVDRWAVVKVGDFGWAARSRGRRTVGGTVDYMAPEVVRGWQGTDEAEETDRPYTDVVDEFSVGMLLFEIVRGASPFLVDKQRAMKTQNDADPARANRDRCTLVRLEIMDTDNLVTRMLDELRNLSSELRGFVELILKQSPEHRLTAKQALEHAFLRNPNDADWKHVVERAMGNALKADAGSFSMTYLEAKPNLRFCFRDTDAAFTSYSQYFTQAKLLGQRPLTPREFLREMQRLFTTATGTFQSGGRLEYLGNRSAWRGVLRHNEGRAVKPSHAEHFPSHMEVVEFAYVGQLAE